MKAGHGETRPGVTRHGKASAECPDRGAGSDPPDSRVGTVGFGGAVVTEGGTLSLQPWQQQGAEPGDTVVLHYLALAGRWERHPLGHWISPIGYWLVERVTHKVPRLKVAA